jgi:hypothetical protein
MMVPMSELVSATTRHDVRGRRAGRAARVTLRPYRRSDDAGLAAVCLATAADGGDGAALYANPGLPGDVYVLPYVRFEPDLCLVVDDGTREGRVSGYVLGTSDTAAFEHWAARAWWPGTRARYPVDAQAPGSADARLAAMAAAPRRRRAPSPTATRRTCTSTCCLTCRARGSGGDCSRPSCPPPTRPGRPGCTSGSAPGNTRAIGFYGRLGFHLVERTDAALLLGRPLP